MYIFKELLSNIRYRSSRNRAISFGRRFTAIGFVAEVGSLRIHVPSLLFRAVLSPLDRSLFRELLRFS